MRLSDGLRSFRKRPSEARFHNDIIDDLDVKRIAFDDWNMNNFKPCLTRAGFSDDRIAKKFLNFRQGFKTMRPALRDFEGRLLEGEIRHGDHPALTMCAANAIVRLDEAGNRKLDKKRAHGRIDGMVALVMALWAARSCLTRPFDAAAAIG
jgi:phage terminase large subunit-like protein